MGALMAWKTIVALDSDELTKFDSVPYVYFDKDLLDGFIPDHSFPYVGN